MEQNKVDVSLLKQTQEFSYIKENLLEIMILKKYYIYFAILTLIVTMLVFSIFRVLTGVIIYIILLASILLLAFIGYQFYLKHLTLTLEDPNDKDFLFIATGLWIAAALLLLICAIFLKEIRNAVKTIEISLEYLIGNVSILILSLITLGLSTVFAALEIGVLAIILNGAEQIFNKDFMFADLNLNQQQWIQAIGTLLLIFWHFEVIRGMHVYAVALSVISWNYEEFTPLGPIICYIKIHFINFGTVAFGSFITSILKVLIILLQLVESRAKQLKEGSILLKVLQCCLCCFERIFQFINDQLYIQSALTSENYCTSLQSYIKMAAGNFMQIQFTIIFTKIIRLLVSISIVISSYFMCKYGLGYLGLNEIPIIDTPGPYIVLVFIGLLISKVFLMNFDIVAQTLLHCSAKENEGQQQLIQEEKQNAKKQHIIYNDFQRTNKKLHRLDNQSQCS